MARIVRIETMNDRSEPVALADILFVVDRKDPGRWMKVVRTREEGVDDVPAGDRADDGLWADDGLRLDREASGRLNETKGTRITGR